MNTNGLIELIPTDNDIFQNISSFNATHLTQFQFQLLIFYFIPKWLKSYSKIKKGPVFVLPVINDK